MRMTGEQRIAASRQRVWEALNDPDTLRRSIPGCQSLEKESDELLRATVEVRIGPIGARFNGAVMLSDMDPPNGYTITGEGQGGTVGSARGGAKVRLTEDNGATLLSYEVEAQVGGRLAQLGGPIIDATAKQLAGKFFTQFGEIVGVPAEGAPVVAPEAAAAPAVTVAPVVAQAGFPWAWAIALALAVLAGFLLGRSGAAEWWILAVAVLVLAAIGAGFESGRRSGGRS